MKELWFLKVSYELPDTKVVEMSLVCVVLMSVCCFLMDYLEEWLWVEL